MDGGDNPRKVAGVNGIDRDAQTLQPSHTVVRIAVLDGQTKVGPQGDNALDIGVDIRAHFRQLPGRRGIIAELLHAADPVALAQGKDNFGEAGGQGDKTLRLVGNMYLTA